MKNNMKEITLENLDELKEGDIVKYNYSFHTGITRIVSINDELCMEFNFMNGRNRPVASNLFEGSSCFINKISLVDLYKFCKENNWDTGKYISEFGKRKV